MNRRSVLLALSAGVATSLVGLPSGLAAPVFRIPVYPGERLRMVETDLGSGVGDITRRVAISFEGPALDRAKLLAPEVRRVWAEVENPICKVRVRDRLGRPWLGAGEGIFTVVEVAHGYQMPVAESAVIRATSFWVNEMFHRRAYMGSAPDLSSREDYCLLDFKARATAMLGHSPSRSMEEEEIGSYLLEITSDSDEVLALLKRRARLWHEINTNTIPRSEAEEDLLHSELNELGRLIYKKRHGLT